MLLHSISMILAFLTVTASSSLLTCNSFPLTNCIICDNTQTCFEIAAPLHVKTQGECCSLASVYPLPFPYSLTDRTSVGTMWSWNVDEESWYEDKCI